MPLLAPPTAINATACAAHRRKCRCRDRGGPVATEPTHTSIEGVECGAWRAREGMTSAGIAPPRQRTPPRRVGAGLLGERSVFSLHVRLSSVASALTGWTKREWTC
eukprot:60577-Chlamydomonas_euryale.AAC.1